VPDCAFGMDRLSRLLRLLASALTATLVLACTADEPARKSDARSAPDTSNDAPTETPPKQARFIRRACDLPDKWIEYVYRGWDGGKARAYDIALVPHPPNYMGSLTDTSHSGPYGFLQRVPLVLFGPGHIGSRGPITIPEEVTLADVAPTVAELLDFRLPERDGKVLDEAVVSSSTPPKLIFTAVIDGGGWNVLDLWGDRWPNIKRLMHEGVSIENAVAGSSPSITPAVHTTLSTGAFPNRHKITAIVLRTDEGQLTEPFAPHATAPTIENVDPGANTDMPTIADLWDLSLENDALVGMVSPGRFQFGMMGLGTTVEGGDKDIAAILSGQGEWATNTRFYSMPGYVNDLEGPNLDAVDRSDGEADGLWRGHAMPEVDATPAFAPWENETIQAMLGREGFGADAITDLFYVNYKAPDAAGHEYNMIAPEQGDVIESVDTAVGDMIGWLDENVGRGEYVFILTADHGQTPLEAGGWPIRPLELTADLDARFDHTDNGQGIVQDTSAATLFMDAAEMRTNRVRPEDVARFLLGYKFEENIAPGDPFPAEFSDRAEEAIFAGAIPGALVDDANKACL
jgi:predicted AlkP superfamily pyrophosphatase or phosphodiesterase